MVNWDAVDFDVAEIPLLWIGQQIQALFKKQFFPPPMMAMLHRFVIDARNGIDGIAMQLNSQLPFAYAHLITTLVHGATMLSAVKTGMVVAVADTYLSIVCNVFFCFALSLVYLGLLALSAVIADPFGDDVIDLPAAQLQRQLWKGCNMLYNLKRPVWQMEEPVEEILAAMKQKEGERKRSGRSSA